MSLNDDDDLFQARLAALSREVIACDACGKPSPLVSCERCQTVYYCDATCRERHAPEHRLNDCHDIAAISRQQEAAIPTKEQLLSSVVDKDAINSECGICLEEKLQEPVTLECKHAFCTSCLVEWQRQKTNPNNEHQFSPDSLLNTSQSSHHTCPVCRTTTEGNVEDELMLRARLLADRASLLGNDPEAQLVLNQKALNVVNQLVEVEVPHLQAFVTKVGILHALGEYQQEIDTIDEIVKINTERDQKVQVLSDMDRRIQQATERSDLDEAGRLMEEYVNYAQEHDLGSSTRMGTQDIVELYIQQAEAHIELEQWQSAIKIIVTKVLAVIETRPPPLVRRCVMGQVKCAYAMKVYDMAIEASEWAIEMNRSFPGVYKYKALSEKAKGDLDAAIATMNRAVLYETPWDNQNRRKALQLYDELVDEKQKLQEQE